jgi:hypothetical protein
MSCVVITPDVAGVAAPTLPATPAPPASRAGMARPVQKELFARPYAGVGMVEVEVSRDR